MTSSLSVKLNTILHTHHPKKCETCKHCIIKPNKTQVCKLFRIYNPYNPSNSHPDWYNTNNKKT